MNKFKSLSILLLLLFSAFSMKIRTSKEGGTEGVAGAVTEGIAFAQSLSK